MRHYALTLTFWLAALAAYAQRNQQHYIVTTQRDTLRGESQLVGKHDQTLILYRPDQAPMRFGAADAISYGDATGPIGVSKQIGAHGTAPVFVTSLVQGYVSLYSGTNADGARRFFLQPADSAYLVEVPPVFTPLALLPLLPGCPALRLEYEETGRIYQYTPNGMSKMVLDYNACRQPQQPNIVNRRPYGLHTRVGVKAGLNASSFTTDAEPFAGKHQQFTGYQAGMIFNFYSQSKISVLIEPTYLALRSEYGPAVVSNGYAYYTTTRRSSIQYSQVQVPLLVRYTIGHNTWRPFLNAGASYGLNFRNRSVQEYHHFVDTDQFVTVPAGEIRPIASPDKRSAGLAAGAGLLLQRPNLPLVSIEARFDHMLDSFGSMSSTHHNSLRLDLGIMF